MKRVTRRETRRLREKRRLEELDRYTALCMQARMLYEMNTGVQDLMNSAMKAAEHLSYGGLMNSVRDLQFTLGDIASYSTEFFNTYYLVRHWESVCRQASTHPRTHAHAHEKTSATTRPDPARSQAKIPGQAARFQNYRR